MAKLLYQSIMDVPGLTGTWQNRLAQYYKKLTGKNYTGSLSEGLYMLKQIENKNYGVQPETSPAPAQAPAPTPTTSATNYAQTGVAAGNAASNTPQFETVMPFYDAWGQMIPQASAAAASQINPEVMRQYKSQYNDYMNGLTSSGGERFGRGLAQGGALKAATERDRTAQMQDWINQYQQGYKNLFYEPSRTAWNTAVTQGQSPDQELKNIPTWEDVYDKSNAMYGLNSGSTSPLYG